jgi:hypothetical protein
LLSSVSGLVCTVAATAFRTRPRTDFLPLTRTHRLDTAGTLRPIAGERNRPPPAELATAYVMR